MGTTAVARSRTDSMKIQILNADERHRPEINDMIRMARIGDGIPGAVKHTWIVRINGRIVACASSEFHGPRVSILEHLVVQWDMRHRGIGAALVKHWMQYARRNGACYLALCSMYYRYRFYKARGFKVAPRQELPPEIKNFWMFTSSRYRKCGVLYQHV